MNLDAKVLQQFEEKSWAIVESALPLDLLTGLKAQAMDGHRAGLFQSAKVGRSQQQALAPAVRSDSIFWLDFSDKALAKKLARKVAREPAKDQETDLLRRHLAQELESLRLVLNQNLFLGLQTFEAHFACYELGAFYEEHLDQPQLKSPLHGERVISFVIYMNEQWKASDGGALCLNLGTELFQVQPLWNRLVLFRSDEIRHSVQAAKSPRWTLTGWFRRN